MEEINIMELFKLLLKRIWILIIVVVLCGAIGFSYCEFLATPKYSSSAKMIVSTGGILYEEDESIKNITAAQVQTSLAMLETYAIAMNSTEMFYIVEGDVKGETSGTYSALQLKGMTSISYSETSLVITVTVTSTDPKDAYMIAKAITKNAPEYLKSFIPSTIAKPLEEPFRSSMVYPNTFMTTMIAGLLGGVIAVAIIWIVALTDNTVKDEDQLITLGLSVIGVVPDFNETEKGGYYHHG